MDDIRTNAVDTETFRLRRFVDGLDGTDGVEIVKEPVKLTEIAARLDGNPKAVLFREAGPEGAEMIGNVMGSRARLAKALGVPEGDFLSTLVERLRNPIAPVEISSEEAPVHQVVLEGEDADFTQLPVHLQHDLDGAPYISATLDIAVDARNGYSNVGMRRMMLRGRREAGIDMQAPSDLKAIYAVSHADGDRMPMAFVVGFNPVDAVAAMANMPPQDEIALIGGVRGAPVPVVKCVTSDIRVPADAEMILEGYLHADGWTEPEGPFGEYVGYYGKLKSNPVFHLTAITHRSDVLFQTATIGGRYMNTTDTAQLSAVKTESSLWASLETAVREPLAVYATPSCGGMYNVRVSMRQRVPGEARNAIAAAFGSAADIKHVFVVDADIDIFSDSQVDWALATRFQADRDLMTATGYRVVPLDPSLQGEWTGAKAGFDCTLPFGKTDAQEFMVPAPPEFGARAPCSVEDALKEGPKYFRELMECAGSDDGREVVRDLEPLYAAGTLKRLIDGRYYLG